MNIVSFSGGKDSTAMLIKMLELNIQVDRIIFADTGYEFPEMYSYIKTIGEYIKKYGNYDIEIIKTEQKLDDWLFGTITRGKSKGDIRGWPLFVYPCYWHRESKFKVLDKEMKGHNRFIGIAVDEKRRMSKNYKENKYHYPLVEWEWTEEMCLEYLKKKGLVNPLYEKFDRLGCWWCPKQSLRSLNILYNDYPELWEKLMQKDKELRQIKINSRYKLDIDLRILERRFYIEKQLGENQLNMFNLLEE